MEKIRIAKKIINNFAILTFLDTVSYLINKG